MSGTPFRQAENEWAQLLARRGQLVGVLGATHEAGSNQLAYFRSAALERAYRDVGAGTFHPLTPEVTLAYAGKLALGDPGVTE